MSTDDQFSNNQPSGKTYLGFHHQLLLELRQNMQQQPPFNTEAPADEDMEYLEILEALCEMTGNSDEERHLGQQLITTTVARYPHITPMVPRDLFWFFGGECMHYLGDEEIERFQSLDEQYHALAAANPEQADYSKLRAAASLPHSGQLN